MLSANNKTSDDPGDNTITIGIDFGTTYSGVAYTWSKKLARIEIITSWDSDLHSNADLEKAPTAISLDSDKHVLWGYSIPHEFGQIRWFKLLLIDKNDLPDDVQNSPKIAEAVAYLEKHNKSAIDIVSLYLRHIWNHATQRIMETISKDMVCSSKLEIVITLPAIWPAYAVGRMRQAARIAGMLGDRDPGPTILTFVSEPEAAALATLSDMQGRHDIKAGDSFVVVDCGGGTVDLISYDMVSLSPATVKECVKGQGGLCGAVFVDEAFTDILKRKFGKNKWRKLGDDARHRIQHDEWENGIKTQFDGSYREWKFTMPWECLEHVDLKPGTLIPKIVITSDEIQRAFDPVLDKIFVMVQEQVAAVTRKKGHGPKYVILVGGFGRSRYLFSYLKKKLGDEIEILQSRGASSWTAICRGAVIQSISSKGRSNLSIDVQGRISRASYGVRYSTTWDPQVHDASLRYFCHYEAGWKAKNQMCWYLNQGDLVNSDKRVTSSYLRQFDTNDDQKQTIVEDIYCTTASQPPKVWNHQVKMLCTVKWETKIDLTTLPTFTNPVGKVIYVLKYDIEMTVAGGIMDFAVYRDGVRQGGKSVMIEYENA